MFEIKRVCNFEELSNREIYQIAQLRTNVFVYEQGIIEEDELDGKDYNAYHLVAIKKDIVVGYLRILTQEAQDELWLGRMCIAKSARREGLAKKMLELAIRFINEKTEWNNRIIKLSGQCYAQGLYEKVGFKSIGEPYDEVGIDHIEMHLVR